MPYFEAFNQFWNVVVPTANAWEVFVFAIKIGGWMILWPFFAWAAFTMIHIWRVGLYMAKFEWIYLAIDVPRDNIQSPRAVENIFAHLAGAHGTYDIAELYWEGEYQRWFSFEIVSMEGYIQFIIRTEKKFRDLVESAVYAQYPEAEITEVEDYTEGIPENYPNDTHEVWGAEWSLVEDHYYPIRTYLDFQDKVAEEDTFKDPMAALLETFSRIGKGEQMWLQLEVQPTGQKWKKGGFDLAKKLMGQEPEKKRTFLNKLTDVPMKALQLLGEGLGVEWFGEGEENGKDKVNFGMFMLTPNERDNIEGIERKVSKVGFKCKIRAAYVAKKENYDKSRVMYGLVGAMKQFAHEGSNSLKPAYKKTGTSAHYIFIEARKNIRRSRLIKAYKARSMWLGIHSYILNTEELATLWHFPIITVKTPLLSRTDVKRGLPPTSLPTDLPLEQRISETPFTKAQAQAPIMATDIGAVMPVTQSDGVSKPDEQRNLGSAPPNLPIA